MKLHTSVLALAVLWAAWAPANVRAQPLETNENFIEEVRRRDDLDVRDLKAVFAFVLRALPERVRVYPTGNDFSFKFFHRGTLYAGSIRLENGRRDEGKVHFSYGVESTEPAGPGADFHKLLGALDGVIVEEVNRLVYRVSLEDKSVLFELNDLTDVKVPSEILAPNEIYIGPVFDESGVRFFLAFNRRLKLFHYFLDETVPIGDRLTPSRLGERIVIGARTGFAFYRDERRDRKILIGVLAANVRANNYLDGPFDQLPENFIEGETLLSAILALQPRLKGRIDRFGSSLDGAARYAITPYLQYGQEGDLRRFQNCARSRLRSVRYYACFVAPRRGPPLAPRHLGPVR